MFFILIQTGKQSFSLTSVSSLLLFLKRKGKVQCEVILTLGNDVKLLMFPDFFRVASLQRAKIQPFDFHVNHSLWISEPVSVYDKVVPKLSQAFLSVFTWLFSTLLCEMSSSGHGSNGQKECNKCLMRALLVCPSGWKLEMVSVTFVLTPQIFSDREQRLEGCWHNIFLQQLLNHISIFVFPLRSLYIFNFFKTCK